ncbi:NADH dehydrogenase [ubiquinone] 1 alpha subcomplex subunit 3 isoform X2 [Loxodonta africana]|uniref:NADH dehydrogenase [ubiquinone] 1 alpha subcomplex subunit 3 isoform X2 n=1 Tax=Loxodonta africana TaxID=9785 RepID=UPI0030CD7A33
MAASKCGRPRRAGARVISGALPSPGRDREKDSPPTSRMPGARSRCWSHPSPSRDSCRHLLGLTLCLSTAIILPLFSPYTKYSSMINQATPYCYPVPLRDDGNMPDVPSHPQDPQGPSLEWLKKL